MPQYLNVFSWGIIHSWAISYCIYSVRPNRNKCIAMDTFPESYLFSGTKKVEVIRLSNPGALHALWNTSQMFVRTRIDPFLFFSFLFSCFVSVSSTCDRALTSCFSLSLDFSAINISFVSPCFLPLCFVFPDSFIVILISLGSRLV